MQLNRRERKELALSKLVLIALAVLGLFIVVWLAWVWPSMRDNGKVINSYKACADAGNPIQDSYPSVCVTNDGKRFVNPDEQAKSQQSSPSSTNDTGTTPTGEKHFLILKEWKVRTALAENVSDMTYAYSTSDLGDRVSFTFKRLQAIDACKTDAGASLTRTGVKNQPPYNIDNPEPIAHVGSYYYYLAYAGSPCYDPENADHMKLVNDITENKASLNATIRSVVQGLQAEQ